MNWRVEQLHPSVHRVKSHQPTKDSVFSLLVLSDVHFDSPECDRRLLAKHMDQAREKGAMVVILGDWFDSMRSTGDRRMTHGARPEHDRLDYLDALVDDSVSFLDPYRDCISVITQGNHESAMKRHHNTDLTRRLADRLGVAHGPYRGWLLVSIAKGKNGEHSYTRKIYYDHGSGGTAPVTRGVIKTNRRAVMVPDADIVISGHIHERWTVEIPRIRLTARNLRPSQDRQLHISSGTYKREDLTEGWAAEKGFGPAALGGVWIDMCWAEGRSGRTEGLTVKAYNA